MSSKDMFKIDFISPRDILGKISSNRSYLRAFVQKKSRGYFDISQEETSFPSL